MEMPNCKCAIHSKAMMRYTVENGFFYIKDLGSKNFSVIREENLLNKEIDIVLLLGYYYPKEIFSEFILKLFKEVEKTFIAKGKSILIIPYLGCTPTKFSLKGISSTIQSKCFSINTFKILQKLNIKTIIATSLFSSKILGVSFKDHIALSDYSNLRNFSFWWTELKTRVFLMEEPLFFLEKEEEHFLNRFFRKVLFSALTYVHNQMHIVERVESEKLIKIIDITSDEQLDEITNDSNREVFSLDIETTSLNFKDGEILSIQFSDHPHKAYFLYLKNTKVSKEAIKRFLKSKRFIFHNGFFDIKFLLEKEFFEKGNFEVEGDTLLAKYSLEPNFRYSLKTLAYFYTYYGGYERDLKEELEEKSSFGDIDYETFRQYAAYDAAITFQIWSSLKKEISEDKNVEKHYKNFYIPCVKTIPSIEREGIKIDTDYYKSFSIELAKYLKWLDENLYKELGEINFRSAKQLTEAILSRYPEIKDKLKFSEKTSQILINSDTLEQYEKTLNLPFAKYLAKRNRLLTLLSHMSISDIYSLFYKESNIDSEKLIDLLQRIDIFDKKIYTKLDKGLLTTYEDGYVYVATSLFKTISGRMASANSLRGSVNFLGLPKYKDYRKIYTSRFGKDGFLLEIDFDSMEILILAHIVGEGPLYQVLRDGMDIHSYFGYKLWNKLKGEITYEEFYQKAKLEGVPEFAKFRGLCKNVSFTAQYGGSYKAVMGVTGISKEEAQQILENYYDTFPEIYSYMKKIELDATNGIPIYSLLGKRLYMRSLKHSLSKYLDKPSLIRTCINFPVQSSASNITILAFINIYNSLRRSKALLSVHDSILFDFYREDYEQDLEIIKEYMTNINHYIEPKIDLPLKCSAKKGLSEEDLGFFEKNMPNIISYE